MTKLLDQAIEKARQLPSEDQDALGAALLSLTEADASFFPLDEATRAAIREGLAQADRGEFISAETIAKADSRLGI